MHTQLASLVSLIVCMYDARVHTYVVTYPLPCGKISRVAFIWDELAETWRHFKGSRISRYGEISGNTVYLSVYKVHVLYTTMFYLN